MPFPALKKARRGQTGEGEGREGGLSSLRKGSRSPKCSDKAHLWDVATRRKGTTERGIAAGLALRPETPSRAQKPVPVSLVKHSGGAECLLEARSPTEKHSRS